MYKFFLITLSIIILPLMPENALAWGPGVHLHLGNAVLNYLPLFLPELSHLVSQNKIAYLYGCLSADILVGKGKKITPTHCHSWDAGLKMLSKVSNDQILSAYALGYLSHLAADVAAHNFYIPNMLQLGLGRGKMSHVYLEMQADQKVNPSQSELKNILNSPMHEADKLLIKNLKKSKFTFGVKKKFFKSLLAVSKRRSYKNSLKLLKKRNPDRHCSEYLDDMLDLSLDLIFDCLKNLAHSEVVNHDPMGFKNLKLVKQAKRSLPRFRLNNAGLMFFMPSMQLQSAKAVCLAD